MSSLRPAPPRIREIDPQSESEIALVARRMRETLVEVLGEEKGTAMYSMDWLLARVRWHIDPTQTVAKIFLAEHGTGETIGHAIARVERDDSQNEYGYFSTVFVEPASRNQGTAAALVQKVEAWFRQLKMPKIAYNTAGDHAKLIRLFERHGFAITHRADEMVQLTKTLEAK